MSDLLKRYLTGTVIKADLELFKDAFAAQEIEAYAETFRRHRGGTISVAYRLHRIKDLNTLDVVEVTIVCSDGGDVMTADQGNIYRVVREKIIEFSHSIGCFNNGIIDWEILENA